MTLPEIEIRLPDWIHQAVDFQRAYASDQERMAVAILLARQNMLHETGGPFGAAIFEMASGRLVAVGVNLVVPLNNSVLHGEMVAFMMAQARLGSYTLKSASMPAHELVTSCDPCAMCLGATLWAGVRRVVCGATRDDAAEIFFDEGPVFSASWDYLAARGVDVTREVLRPEARAVLVEYAIQNGTIYNG
ncbi:MAG: nucleoside deaminase [Longimicrobiales bacterium]